MSKRKLLLISNSRKLGDEYLEHAEEVITNFLGKDRRRALFIPFAACNISYEQYTQTPAERFRNFGYDLQSIHELKNHKTACAEAEAIVVGGGNTFQLLKKLYDTELLGPIRKAVESGIPFIGWSAGATICCPTIKTTNDMPVVWPHTPDALDLVPFQINPHYTDELPMGFSGESRERRIGEFVALHQKVYVVGLRENTMLEVQGQSIRLLGELPAKVFLQDQSPAEYTSEDSLNFLLA